MIARAETIDWKYVATALIRAIDPSYSGPCYLLEAQEASTKLDPRTAGITWPYLDMALRDTLRARGEWKGRGFACLVDSRHPYHLATKSEGDALRRCVTTTLHEYCHWIDRPDPWGESVIDDLFKLSPDFAKAVEVPETIGPKDPKQEPWHHHTGDKFGRLAMHAFIRVHCAAPEFVFDLEEFWCTELLSTH